MYRIMLATSGSYYVQELQGSGYKMVGGFFKTKTGARNFARDMKDRCRCAPGLVEYVY